MVWIISASVGLLYWLASPQVQAGEHRPLVLEPDAFRHYVESLNAMEEETMTNEVPNAGAWNWMRANIPFFECPDPAVETIYYYRWWSFRKHLKLTPQGFVITEFLTPVSHAGVFNTISCAAGHHLAEGRWLHDPQYLNDYILFWLRGNDGKPQGHFHKFSSWFAAAAWERYLVNWDAPFLIGILEDLVADYHAWEEERLLPGGLFWQYDVRDGMEESISGSRREPQARPTINSYMYANARAIGAIAKLASKAELAKEFNQKAETLQRLTLDQLWNPDANFFEVRHPENGFANVREEIGFIPWRFRLPKAHPGYDIAWAQLMDPEGFRAPFGITTAERRHPDFRSHGVGTCEWDGAVWPFATTQTLGALANLLQDNSLAAGDSHAAATEVIEDPVEPRSLPVTQDDYFDAFLTYVVCQHADGKPYIGEYLDEVTGDWINGRNGRSRYYNHSTFADLLITGLVGLCPRPDDTIDVHPLLPAGTWDWFCLDGVVYHGHRIAIIWDQDGSRYGRGAGLRILVDGKEIAAASELEHITGRLP